MAYLMSAVANQTSPNLNKNGGCVGFKFNGNGKYPSTMFQRPKRDKKIVTCWGCGGSGHSWRECSTLRQGNTLPFRPNTPSPNQGNRPNLSGQQGRYHKPPILSQWQLGRKWCHWGTKTSRVQDEPEYYNPNPWAMILGRANETDVEIDGIISNSLIDSGAMISMMSRGYCEEHG